MHDEWLIENVETQETTCSITNFLRERAPENLELLEETDKKVFLQNQLIRDIQTNSLLNRQTSQEEGHKTGDQTQLKRHQEKETLLPLSLQGVISIIVSSFFIIFLPADQTQFL